MNAVHVDELRDPGREFPKAMFLAMGLVLLIFILPALAISWVIPSQQLSLTAGVMEAFSALLAHLRLTFAVPLMAVALAVASLSGMMALLAGPSKGLLKIAREHGYLPGISSRSTRRGSRCTSSSRRDAWSPSWRCCMRSSPASRAPTGSSRQWRPRCT